MKKTFVAFATTLIAISALGSFTSAQANPLLQSQSLAEESGFKRVASLGSVKVKTTFGYVTINNVKRPQKYKCVTTPVVVDIRNIKKLNMFGISIDLVDDFDNIVAHSVVDTYDDVKQVMKKNGIYKTTMEICAKNRNWKGLYYFEDPIQAIGSSNLYTIEVKDWLHGGLYGYASFTLKK